MLNIGQCFCYANGVAIGNGFLGEESDWANGGGRPVLQCVFLCNSCSDMDVNMCLGKSLLHSCLI